MGEAVDRSKNVAEGTIVTVVLPLLKLLGIGHSEGLSFGEGAGPGGAGPGAGTQLDGTCFAPSVSVKGLASLTPGPLREPVMVVFAALKVPWNV